MYDAAMNERMARGPGFVRSHGFTLVASAVVLVLGYALCRRAINLTDEGYLLSQALDMLGGKVLYREESGFDYAAVLPDYEALSVLRDSVT